MIFPEHMEFRYYIPPERQECFALYSKTLGQRRTILEKTQDVGQCLIDLYDTDFYDAYCVLSEIQKLVRETGLEPVRVAPHAPQTCASADSATLASTI